MPLEASPSVDKIVRFPYGKLGNVLIYLQKVSNNLGKVDNVVNRYRNRVYLNQLISLCILKTENGFIVRFNELYRDTIHSKPLRGK